MLKKLTLLFLLIFGLGLVVATASADWRTSATSKLNAAVGSQSNLGFSGSLESTAGSAVKGALALVGAVFLILTVYAGILWMTAAGKEEQTGKAQKIITASVIGLFIVVSAYAITNFVTTKLAGGGGGAAGSEATSPDNCAQLGGDCIDMRANDNDPCDPDGTGSDDWYTGTVLTQCDANRVCCELKESAGGGARRCERMGGSCENSCADRRSQLPGRTALEPFIESGECEKPSGDVPCCVPPR